MYTMVISLRGDCYGEGVMERMTEFFDKSEFECKCRCGTGTVVPDLVDRIQLARTLLKQPISITSAFRCPFHNKGVGGSDTSSHLKGLALDLKCDNSPYRHKLLAVLMIYFPRIGIAKDFIHVDLDPDKDQGVVWLY